MVTPGNTREGMRSLTASEQAAIAHLITEHGAHLLRFLATRTSDTADREDVVQETWLRLANYDNLASIENPRAFLFRTAENILKDRQRRAAFRQEDSHIPIEDASVEDPAPSQERVVQGSQALAAFKQSLNTLRPKPRQAFLLSRMDDMHYRDIAKHMGVSVKSVEKYISDALAHIRKALGDENPVGGTSHRASLEKGTRK